MNFFLRSKKRRANPFLNIIWPILFVPVGAILYLIWKEKMPWMEGEPFGEDLRGNREETAVRAHGKFPAQKVQDAQDIRQPERSPDEKRQKDTAKGARRTDRQDELESDDLEIIEGIGPKTASILREAGIRTFGQLAETSVDRIREILLERGMIARLNPPDSWPEQARLAQNADWSGLEQLKNRLNAGRDR